VKNHAEVEDTRSTTRQEASRKSAVLSVLALVVLSVGVPRDASRSRVRHGARRRPDAAIAKERKSRREVVASDVSDASPRDRRFPGITHRFQPPRKAQYAVRGVYLPRGEGGERRIVRGRAAA